MSTIDKLATTLKDLIDDSNDRKPSGYDTTAEVLKVDGDTVWVHIPGGIDETPVKRTIDAKEGDLIRLHIEDGNAWITGNDTAPPTDDRVANYAVKNVTELAETVEPAVEYVGNLESKNVTVDSITAATGYIKDLEAEQITAEDLAADHAEIQDLDVNYAHITKGVIDNAKISYADVNNLSANYAHINNGVIDNAKIGYADVNDLNAHYAEIDLANVNSAWIEDGIIKDAAISDAKIIGVSANKLTAGTIDASNIIVTNLNASNITTGTLNGQRIGTGSLSLDKLSEAVYTETEIDGMLDTMQAEIDGAIETFTGTVVPTLNNAPASSWTTADDKAKHVGDVYYVVNAASQADGYCYRFAYDTQTSTYSWVLIKDSDVTAALQRLIDVEGDVSDLQEFESETSSWISNTDEELTSIKSNHTSLVTRVDKTLISTTQLWFSKANTTAPSKPTSEITSTSTNGNAWRTVVPAYNKSYPNYFYCYQWKYADNTFGWSSVTRDIAMGESQERARTAITNAATAQTAASTADGKAVAAQNTANANIKSTTQLWFTKANTTAPSKPTAHITTNDATKSNEWNIAVPTYSSSYPYYYYCYEYQKGDNTYSWSDVVYDRATTENQSNARSALSQVATKVETSTFNTLSQTVDSNTANITSLTTITTNNGLTSSTNITNTVNEVSQTANGNSSKISSLTQTLGTNADGTTKIGDIVHQVSQIDQDLSGITTRVGNTEVHLAGMYATSSTAAGTAAKTATITPAVPSGSTWTLGTGTTITVKFINANTQSSPTLNINSTGAKAIKTYSGGTLSESEYKWKAGDTFTFTYNGTNWLMQDSTVAVRMKTAETSISQNAEAISLRATKTELDDAIDAADARLETLEAFNSEFTVTPQAISSEVTATQNGETLVSRINQTANSVKINANHVEINGQATFNAIKTYSDNAYDTKGAASTAQAAAASDATTKANNAKSEAISAAASDATTKANNAKAAAASDATTKANNAKSEAISAAASDATTKANNAKSEAISAAASDATNKVNAVEDYTLYASAPNVKMDTNGADPKSITVSAKHKQGANDPSAYSGRFKIETTNDGTSWTTLSTSSANESSKTFNTPTAIENKDPYILRKTLDGADGVVDEKAIIGGTVAWNQLVQNGNFADTSGIGYGRGTISVANNILSYTVTETGNFVGSNYFSENVKLVNGHKYLVKIDVKSPKVSAFRFAFYDSATSTFDSVNASLSIADTWTTLSAIVDYSKDGGTCAIRIGADGRVLAVNDVIQYRNYNIYDITQMFVSTIADYVYNLEQTTSGSGVAWLKSHGFLTKDYYAYNEGSLLSVKTSEHRTSGKNLLKPYVLNDTTKGITFDYKSDGSVTVSGTASNNVVRPLNSWVLSNNAYTILEAGTYVASINTANLPTGVSLNIMDADENDFVTRNRTFTLTKPTKVYMRFYVASGASLTTPLNDAFMIRFADVSDAIYEPYHINSYPLDSDLELRGLFKLDANNNLYADGDVYESSGNVSRKYGIVDLGTLTWGQHTTYSDIFFASVDDKALGNFNILCSRYPTTNSTSLPSMGNGTIKGSVSYGYVYIKDSSYTDAQSFKTAMSGVYLVYELATPTTEQADPYINLQVVDKNGIEEYVDTRDIPIPAGHISSYASALKSIRASLYKAGGTTTLLDQLLIPCNVDAGSSALAVANNVSNNSASKANAVKRTQRIYYQNNSTSAPATPGVTSSNWVTDQTGNSDRWTLKRMSYSSSKPYIWTCEQRELANGVVSYTPVLLDDTTTVIDGGKIITGSVTANQLASNSVTADKIAANSVTAEKIKSRTITADRIASGAITANELAANSITIGNMDSTTATKVNNGDSALTLTNYYNRSCIVRNSSTVPTNQWRKFASRSITAKNTDNYIIFDVSPNGDFNNLKRFGRLKAHIRTAAVGVFGNATLEWVNRGEGISLSNFVLCYKATEGTDVKVELWCKCTTQYSGYVFNMVEEGNLTSVSTTALWTLYNKSSAEGSSAPTSGYTQITSTDIDQARKTATDNITTIDSNGIWVTPSGKKPTNTSTGAGATGTKIDGTGVGIYNAGSEVAFYGSNARIGPEANGKGNILIDGDAIKFRLGTNNNQTDLGTFKNVTGTYVSDGLSIISSGQFNVYSYNQGPNVYPDLQLLRVGPASEPIPHFNGWCISNPMIKTVPSSSSINLPNDVVTLIPLDSDGWYSTHSNIFEVDSNRIYIKDMNNYLFNGVRVTASAYIKPSANAFVNLFIWWHDNNHNTDKEIASSVVYMPSRGGTIQVGPRIFGVSITTGDYFYLKARVFGTNVTGTINGEHLDTQFTVELL